MEKDTIQDDDLMIWYFTFGLGHKYARHYVKIIAPFNVARNWMVKKYGTKWAFQYGENEYDNCIAAYNYKELECITEEPIIEDADSCNINEDNDRGGY